MNRVPHLLQVDSSGIFVPQVSQNLYPGLTGVLQWGQMRVTFGGEAGSCMERSLAFTC
jgi:hypothetical protein